MFPQVTEFRGVADAAIAVHCRREEFRPSLAHDLLLPRGERGGQPARAELRKVGQAKITANGKAAKDQH